MKRLTGRNFDRAVEYVREKARPLDHAFMNYVFFDAEPAEVRTELDAFKNADGGYRGLEMDMRTTASSPMATSIALRYLSRLGQAPAPETIAYLQETLDPKTRAWPTVGPAVNDAPHAPWWKWNPQTGRTAAGSVVNPSAEIVAYLPKGFDDVAARCAQYLADSPDKMEMHDLIPLLELHEARGLGDREKLVRVAQTIVTRDPQDWTGYATKPLWLATTPHSPLLPALRELVELGLDWEIDRQGADGSWGPNWSWFGEFPESWPAAEREWRGFITVKMLDTFREFDRIDL